MADVRECDQCNHLVVNHNKTTEASYGPICVGPSPRLPCTCNRFYEWFDHNTERKPAVALQLLVIDLGDSCVVKVEKGDAHVLALREMFEEGLFVGDCIKPIRLVPKPFAELRTTIDALDDTFPPIPRMERSDGTLGGRDGYCLVSDDVTFLSENKYLALCELAGVTIPVYEPKAGKWERLPSTAEYMGDPLEGAGVKIWRYER